MNLHDPIVRRIASTGVRAMRQGPPSVPESNRLPVVAAILAPAMPVTTAPVLIARAMIARPTADGPRDPVAEMRDRNVPAVT